MTMEGSAPPHKVVKMLDDLVLTPDALTMVDDPRIRKVLTGLSAGAKLPAVVNAFIILYDDVAPISFAGNTIYKVLRKPVLKLAEAEAELKDGEGYSPTLEELTTARLMFDLVDKDGSGGLTCDEVLESGLLAQLQKNGRSVEDFMREVDADDDGDVTFLEFVRSGAATLFGEGEDSSAFVSDAGLDAVRLLQNTGPDPVYSRSQVSFINEKRCISSLLQLLD